MSCKRTKSRASYKRQRLDLNRQDKDGAVAMQRFLSNVPVHQRPLQEDGEHVELAAPAVQENVEVELAAVAGPAAAVQENVEVELAAVAGPAAAVQENVEVELADVAGPAAAVQENVEVELAAVAGPAAAVQENVEVEIAAVAGTTTSVQENVEVELAAVAGPAAAVQENVEVELADVAGPAASVQENVEVELAAVAGPAAAVREDSGDAEAQLGENIFHEAGTWPRYVPDELRVELVLRGPLGFQNKDGPFPANPETNRSMNRRWFYKVLGNGEQLLRSLLMCSPSLDCGQ